MLSSTVANQAVLSATNLLVGVILIVSLLTFFPVLSLGPILEHLLLHAGRTF